MQYIVNEIYEKKYGEKNDINEIQKKKMMIIKIQKKIRIVLEIKKVKNKKIKLFKYDNILIYLALSFILKNI